MNLFDLIVNNELFQKTETILFLNKKDIFENKVKKTPLAVCFPDYAGQNSFDEASTFIYRKFEELHKSPKTKQVYTHFTCATDTRNIELIFNCISDKILQNNLKHLL